MGACEKSMKLGLIIGSFVYGIVGCVTMGMGVFLSVDQLSFVSEVFVTPLLLISSGLIAASGTVVFLISFIGCFGTFLRNQSALLVYFASLCIVYLLASSGVAMSIVFRSWVTEQLRSHMNDVLHNEYGVNLNNTRNQIVTRSWDTAQQKWYCCGIDEEGWAVYRGSQWFSEQPGVPGMIEHTKLAVPESCCRKDQYGKYIDLKKCQRWIMGPPYAPGGRLDNEALHYRGCFETGSDNLYGISLFLIAMGLVVALAAIAAIVLSLFYAKKLD